MRMVGDLEVSLEVRHPCHMRTMHLTYCAFSLGCSTEEPPGKTNEDILFNNAQALKHEGEGRVRTILYQPPWRSYMGCTSIQGWCGVAIQLRSCSGRSGLESVSIRALCCQCSCRQTQLHRGCTSSRSHWSSCHLPCHGATPGCGTRCLWTHSGPAWPVTGYRWSWTTGSARQTRLWTSWSRCARRRWRHASLLSPELHWSPQYCHSTISEG